MLAVSFEFFPEQASTLAPKVDALFTYISGVTLLFGGLIALIILVFAIRFRRRSSEQFPEKTHLPMALEITWMVVPFIIVMVMFAWGANVFTTIVEPPDDALEIYVVGRQWMWKIQHPQGQREINTLHIPVGRPVKLIMTSEDVIHSFYVPVFRTKQDVLPGRYTTTWFEATKPGEYHLLCAEYCGTEHSKMIGKVVVLEPDDYQTWLTQKADGSLAQEGLKLFKKLQCITCHGGGAQARAPILEDIYKKTIPLVDNESVYADDNYIRESIVQPAAKVVAGWEPIMPTYEGQVNEEELIQLLAYIKSLKHGQTPPRVEDTPPPAKPMIPEKSKKQ